MLAGLVLMVLGIVATLFPWLGFVEMNVITGGAVSFGGLVLSAAGLFMTILRLYVKTSANMAFVRTGSGGNRTVLDGGAVVIPLVHNMIPISLETMKLDVERVGEEALITKDNLRVDVRGEFFIKVAADSEDIKAAARSLGEKGTNPDQVARLVFEKLVSALRSVAATMELADIHSRREDFAKAVFESVREDLKHNGLTLESVTISRLDQTDPSTLRDDNIFDAQGKKKITEITQSAQVERNRLTRDAEQQKASKDVETRRQILALERQQAEAEASQAAEVANIRAAKEREQKEFAIEQQRLVREAEIQQQQLIEQRRIAQELAVQTADLERQKTLIAQEQAREQADIERKKTVEVAARQQQIAVATKEAERAAAEKLRLEAEAAREAANQQVLTVQVTQEASREAEKRLIAAKQEIEQAKIKRQTDAEVEAFALVKQAEAEQLAAEREAAARLQRAEAEAKATRMQAEADEARKMVDVNIERGRVEVEQARVDVERQSLENKQTFERAAIEFETAKLQIEAEKEVRIALANSYGQFMARGNFQIFGDPTTLAAMTQQFTRGLQVGSLLEGLSANLPEEVRQLGQKAIDAVSRMTSGGDGKAAAPAEEPAPQEAELADEAVAGENEQAAR